MSKGKIQKSSPLIAAAMAVSATGLFAAAGPAQALPPAPLAPGDCAQWGFPGPVTLTQSTGEVLTFNATGPGASGPAPLKQPNGATKQGSIFNGSIDSNGRIFLIWKQNSEDLQFVHFNGDVGPDGRASGTRDPNSNVTWNATTPMVCATKGEATADAKSREVTGDVDAYDVPGGGGTIIGVLQGGEGQRVNLGSGCKEDNWCNVAFPAGPGGTAWVWGDFLK